MESSREIKSASGLYVARLIEDPMDWGVGDIKPIDEYSDPESQLLLVRTTLDCIEKVSPEEMRYSCCTDGRCPLHLANGEQVPLREQIVGTDSVMLLFMAEALGSNFYKNPDGSLEERIDEVFQLAMDNDVVLSTHISCGAAAGFGLINKNLTTFVEHEDFNKRQNLLLSGNYDNNVRRQLSLGYYERQNRNEYDNVAPLIMNAVERHSGQRAIAVLEDDGRGVHGHVEELNMHLRMRGYAINERKLMEITGGREVFASNDARLEYLAELISRGNPEYKKIALMAGQDFTDGGHGTLSRHLPTYIVEEA